MTDETMSESKTLELRRILALARPELPRLVVATTALLVSSTMTLLYPQAVRLMIDSLLGGSSPVSFDNGVLLLATFFAVGAVFGMLRAWLFTVAGERIVADLRTRVFEAILDKDVEFFDLRRTGELTNRLAADTGVLQNTVTVNISMALRHCLAAVGGIGLLIWMSPRLAVVAMAIVPVGVMIALFYGRMFRRLSRRVQDALAAAGAIAEEVISGIRTVRSFSREKEEVVRYGEAVDESYRLAAKRALAIGGLAGIMGFVGYGAIALVVWYGGQLVTREELTMGELTAFLLYTGIVAVSLSSLGTLYGNFMRAAGASQRIFELLDHPGRLESAGGRPVGDVVGRLRFEAVNFAYPSRREVAVLRDFYLEADPGEVVALVGPSGSGKSTVAALIPRFYDPDSGRITLDGEDLSSFSARSLRERIGAVMQEPVLFAESIRENIRYGRPAASDEEVREAATLANASGFIEAFPDGYDTLIGERGVRLSGGQKQRVAIARAILKDPRILILDEATSALDAESEQLVQEALDRLMKGRTTIVIAHRLSTVRNANRVVVLEDGAVAETGSHDELMAAGGLYRRLVERQLTAGAPV
jgi:ATP-binding cassette subfamily B protein